MYIQKRKFQVSNRRDSAVVHRQGGIYWCTPPYWWPLHYRQQLPASRAFGHSIPQSEQGRRSYMLEK